MNFTREWREYRGLTQAQVEDALGWPVSRVARLETGGTIVTDSRLYALSRMYCCSPGDLLDRPPPPTDRLCNEIKVLLAEGASLADLTAIWIVGQSSATAALRREVFEMHCKAIWELVEHYDVQSREE